MCACELWGMGVYSIFMNMHICLCAIPFNSSAGRQCFMSDSCNVNKVGMVNRKSGGWSQGGGKGWPKAVGGVGQDCR